MKTDIEMLEAAAKAAGRLVEGLADKILVDPEHRAGGLIVRSATGGSVAWNPLTDDGDALRLAVAMALEIRPGVGMVTAAGDGVWEEVPTADYTREQATRRAIVEAAAIIGAR